MSFIKLLDSIISHDINMLKELVDSGSYKNDPLYSDDEFVNPLLLCSLFNFPEGLDYVFQRENIDNQIQYMSLTFGISFSSDKSVAYLLRKNIQIDFESFKYDIWDFNPIYSLGDYDRIEFFNTTVLEDEAFEEFKDSINLKFDPVEEANQDEIIGTFNALLSHGYDLNIVNHDGYNFLELARFRNMGKVELFFESIGLSDNLELEDEVELSVKNGEHASLIEAMEQGMSPDQETKDGGTLLSLAIEHNDPKSVEILLKYGANPNYRGSNTDFYGRKGEFPLNRAARIGDLEIVNLLLEFGADKFNSSSPGKLPLYFAVVNGNKDLFKTLSYSKEEVDKLESDKSCLIQEVIVNTFLEGAESELRFLGKRRISFSEFYQNITKLLEMGFNVNSKTTYNRDVFYQVFDIKHLSDKSIYKLCRLILGVNPLPERLLSCLLNTVSYGRKELFIKMNNEFSLRVEDKVHILDKILSLRQSSYVSHALINEVSIDNIEALLKKHIRNLGFEGFEVFSSYGFNILSVIHDKKSLNEVKQLLDKDQNLQKLFFQTLITNQLIDLADVDRERQSLDYLNFLESQSYQPEPPFKELDWVVKRSEKPFLKVNFKKLEGLSELVNYKASWDDTEKKLSSHLFLKKLSSYLPRLRDEQKQEPLFWRYKFKLSIDKLYFNRENQEIGFPGIQINGGKSTVAYRIIQADNNYNEKIPPSSGKQLLDRNLGDIVVEFDVRERKETICEIEINFLNDSNLFDFKNEYFGDELEKTKFYLNLYYYQSLLKNREVDLLSLEFKNVYSILRALSSKQIYYSYDIFLKGALAQLLKSSFKLDKNVAEFRNYLLDLNHLDFVLIPTVINKVNSLLSQHELTEAARSQLKIILKELSNISDHSSDIALNTFTDNYLKIYSTTLRDLQVTILELSQYGKNINDYIELNMSEKSHMKKIMHKSDLLISNDCLNGYGKIINTALGVD